MLQKSTSSLYGNKFFSREWLSYVAFAIAFQQLRADDWHVRGLMMVDDTE